MKQQLDILLCEDDPNLGKLLRDFLDRKGYSTTWAQDGAEGVRRFRVGSYDFVILDVMMPVKDGYQVAEEIRTLNQARAHSLPHGEEPAGGHPTRVQSGRR